MYLNFTDKAPEEITAVIEMHRACFIFLIFLIPLFTGILSLVFIPKIPSYLKLLNIPIQSYILAGKSKILNYIEHVTKLCLSH